MTSAGKGFAFDPVRARVGAIRVSKEGYSPMKRFDWACFTASIAVSCSTTFAEVMDKEPTLREIWSTVPQGVVIGFIACRIYPWLALLSLPHTLSMHLGVIDEMTGPIGPAMWDEAGLRTRAQIK